MHLHVRLAPRLPDRGDPRRHRDVGLLVAAALPIVQGDDVLTVLPGTLPRGRAGAAARRQRCRRDHEGRPQPAEDPAGAGSGRASSTRAVYVERGTMAGRRDRCRSPTRRTTRRPISRMVLVPGWAARPMSGRLAVVGLGPGDAEQVTPEAAAAVAARERSSTATGPISTALRAAPGQTRARLRQPRGAGARRGGADARPPRARDVAVVSGGDPGVFAMAAAVCEAIEAGPAAWRALEVAVVPGITAMLAVAARIGAPLGHDFCAHLAVGQSEALGADRARGCEAAAGAGFVIALYNPISRARPWQLGRAFEMPAPRSCRRRRRSSSAAPPAAPDERIEVVTAGRGRRRQGRHGDLHHHRLARRPASSSAAAGRRWSTRRVRRRAASTMIEPSQQRSRRSRPRGTVRQRRAGAP